MRERSQGLVLAVAVILAVALVAGGVAVLARSDGGSGATNGADRLVGTPHADRIDGLGGPDVIIGRGGPDALTGGGGSDSIFGGGGRDRIRARDRRQDKIDCGRGRDTVIVDRAEDGVYDCERVRVPKSFQRAGG